jgi:hypothetical protein
MTRCKTARKCRTPSSPAAGSAESEARVNEAVGGSVQRLVRALLIHFRLRL